MAFRERARLSLGTSARRSRTLERGRGDARAHRTEQQRLTENAYDEEMLEIVRSKLTINFSTQLRQKLVELVQGAGLETEASGKIAVKLSRNMGLDRQGRIGNKAGDGITRLGAPPGTASAARTLGGTTDDDISTIAAVLNELLDALSLSVTVEPEP